MDMFQSHSPLSVVGRRSYYWMGWHLVADTFLCLGMLLLF
jgi:hypothetical protein